MNRSRLPLILMFLVLGMVGSVRVHAETMHTLAWNNPTAYTDGTPIPSSLLITVESRIFYSYDKQLWSLFATVPDGGVSWTGLLPPGEGVQAYYAVSATIPGEGPESAKSEPVEFPSSGETSVRPFTVVIDNCEDTYVNSGNRDFNQYSTESLIRTYSWFTGGEKCSDCHILDSEPKRGEHNVANRGFIKWDLSSLPAGITVANATLRLYYVEGDNRGYNPFYTVSVAKVIGVDPVIPLCTWDTVDGIAPWTGGEDGGESDLATAESSAGIGTTHGWVTWDVTKMVQEWVASPGTNHGMAVDADNFAIHGSNRYFASREYPDPNLRPQLVLRYTIRP
jgi:hypothetical protein